ncbi:uncharacterized protein ISCGN_020967 [Ixodes scapularis]
MFAVVRFLSDNSVDVVPSNWLNGNECLWPSKFRASRAIKAVKLRESPDLTYTRHSIVILSKEEAVRLIKGLSGATLEEIEAGAKGWLKNCRACVNSATKRKLPRV